MIFSMWSAVFLVLFLRKEKSGKRVSEKNSKVAKRKRKTHANSNLQTFIILIWCFHSLLLIFQRSPNWKSWEKLVMKSRIWFHVSRKYPCTTLYIFCTDLRFAISLSSLFLHQKVTINFTNCSIRASLGMWGKSGRLQHTEGLSK